MRDAGGGAEWIDPVIHVPARLLIVKQLFVVDAVDATFLVNQTGLTWGNLGSHLSRLETAGYVEVEKRFRAKKPCTMIRLTEKGRAAFREYRAKMQETLSDIPDR